MVVPPLDPTADRRTDHELGGIFPTRSIAILGQLVHDLIVGRPNEVRELDFDHGHHAVQRHAHSATHDAVLAERRVDYAVFTELFTQAGGDAKYAAYLAHVFTQHDDALVASHRRAQGLVDGHHHVHLRHRYRSGATRPAKVERSKV